MSACPEPELLNGLLSSSLTVEDEATVRTHLMDCSACRSALTGSPTTRSSPAGLDGPARRHPMSTSRAWQRMVEGLEQSTEDAEVSAVADRAPIALGPPQVVGDLGTIGPYRVLKELGRGGLGVVLHGYDENLGRPVAIKLIHPERLDGDTHRHLAGKRVTSRGSVTTKWWWCTRWTKRPKAFPSL